MIILGKKYIVFAQVFISFLRKDLTNRVICVIIKQRKVVDSMEKIKISVESENFIASKLAEGVAVDKIAKELGLRPKWVKIHVLELGLVDKDSPLLPVSIEDEDVTDILVLYGRGTNEEEISRILGRGTIYIDHVLTSLKLKKKVKQEKDIKEPVKPKVVANKEVQKTVHKKTEKANKPKVNKKVIQPSSLKTKFAEKLVDVKQTESKLVAGRQRLKEEPIQSPAKDIVKPTKVEAKPTKVEVKPTEPSKSQNLNVLKGIKMAKVIRDSSKNSNSSEITVPIAVANRKKGLRNKVTDAERQEYIRLFKSGKSPTEIAVIYDRSIPVITKTLTDAGLYTPRKRTSSGNKNNQKIVDGGKPNNVIDTKEKIKDSVTKTSSSSQTKAKPEFSRAEKIAFCDAYYGVGNYRFMTKDELRRELRKDLLIISDSE